MDTISEQRCFDGLQGRYSHASSATGTTMKFSVYQPAQARHGKVPALYYLAGLTCDDETFMLKAGAQRLAAKLGLMLVSCDTSPRGLNDPGDSEQWDFGVGAGFYLDATQLPWAAHYRMSRYINDELPTLIEAQFPALPDRRGIFGHSMGGHGALVTALRHPERWQSVSAFAPVCNPCRAPWGEKAFTNYLGTDRTAWREWDASELMAARPHPAEFLVDQGEADKFCERELQPQTLRAAAEISGQKLKLRLHAGYDHSYWFIQTFIADHLAHHAQALLDGNAGELTQDAHP